MKYVNAISIKKNHFLKNFTKTSGLLTGIGNEIQFFLVLSSAGWKGAFVGPRDKGE